MRQNPNLQDIIWVYKQKRRETTVLTIHLQSLYLACRARTTLYGLETKKELLGRYCIGCSMYHTSLVFIQRTSGHP